MGCNSRLVCSFHFLDFALILPKLCIRGFQQLLDSKLLIGNCICTFLYDGFQRVPERLDSCVESVNDGLNSFNARHFFLDLIDSRLNLSRG